MAKRSPGLDGERRGFASIDRAEQRGSVADVVVEPKQRLLLGHLPPAATVIPSPRRLDEQLQTKVTAANQCNVSLRAGCLRCVSPFEPQSQCCARGHRHPRAHDIQ